MTVRKMSKTTLSVTALFIGFVFFRIYYINLLSKFMQRIYDNDNYIFVIMGKLFPNRYIGSYFPALFYCCVIIIIAARIIDAILDWKTVLGVISPFKLPLLLTFIITAAICIEKLNMLQLWAIFYLCILICLHSTFKRMIAHSETTGSYPNLKLFKNYIITIKNAILKVISTGIKNFSNPVDEIAILSASAMVLLAEAVVLISCIIFFAMHWRLIFLSHIIN